MEHAKVIYYNIQTQVYSIHMATQNIIKEFDIYRSPNTTPYPF
jgi:hypothetical protein